MILFTGDVHGQLGLGRFTFLHEFHRENPDEKIYIIVCGDMGCCWDGGEYDKATQEYLSTLPAEFLFIDGNHENFDILDNLPVEARYGGLVHKVTDNVYHLMRGEIFEIEGKTILAFGGAASIDKGARIEGYSWWKQEAITMDDLVNAIDNYAIKGLYKVDVVLTHASIPHHRFILTGSIRPKHDQSEGFIADLLNYISYDYHFFGHYHEDKLVEHNTRCLYNDLYEFPRRE